MYSQDTGKDCKQAIQMLGTFFLAILCIIALVYGDFAVAFVLGLAVVINSLSIYVAKRRRRILEWSIESSPTLSSSPQPATVNTVSSAVGFSSPPLHPQPRRPSPPTPPTGRRPSHSSESLSSQLSHAYYTNSSNFSPYITSQSIEERSSVHSPSTTWSPSPSAPIIIGFTPSDAAQHLSTRLTANELPPAYPEVMEDSRLPQGPYMTPSTSGGYGEVFGPSSDGLPSYETVVATRQPRGDSPPPYTPS